MSVKADNIIAMLIKAGVSSPRLEANIFIKSAKNDDELLSFINRRLQNEPVCKIVGHKDFYKYTFKVSDKVLSPRPDTETLVEKAIEIIKKENLHKVLELGVGSGCIILSILAEFSDVFGIGVDISNDALDIARENAQNLGVCERVRFANQSWFDMDLEKKLGTGFDMIVSNPPYIPSKDILGLDKDVKNYDPLLALDGGEDGLRDYRRLAELSPSLLSDNGYILLEVGINQSNDVVEIFFAKGFSLIDIVKDLSGIERCIILKK